MHLKIGTRGSILAQAQARWVAAALQQQHPHLRCELVIIRTKGDRIWDAPLAQIGGKGLFVKEIEEALLAGEIDLGVHSLKDLPTELPAGLALGAVPPREDARDVLVSRHRRPLAQLPSGARLGTSSLRRAAQLRAYRPDLEIVGLRGNLDTRLRKAAGPELDGAVLAAAGLLRLGWGEQITEFLPPEVCLPAVGQGALAVEVRAEDGGVTEALTGLDHAPSRQAVSAERAFLRRLGGGCQVPIAAWARVEGASLEIQGLVADPQGARCVRGRMAGPPAQAEELGRRLAEELLQAGARHFLATAR